MARPRRQLWGSRTTWRHCARCCPATAPRRVFAFFVARTARFVCENRSGYSRKSWENRWGNRWGKSYRNRLTTRFRSNGDEWICDSWLFVASSWWRSDSFSAGYYRYNSAGFTNVASWKMNENPWENHQGDLPASHVWLHEGINNSYDFICRIIIYILIYLPKLSIYIYYFYICCP